jgi:hypothetical protein
MGKEYAEREPRPAKQPKTYSARMRELEEDRERYSIYLSARDNRYSKKRGEDIKQSGEGHEYTLVQSRAGFNITDISASPPEGALSPRAKDKAVLANSNSFRKTDPASLLD